MVRALWLHVRAGQRTGEPPAAAGLWPAASMLVSPETNLKILQNNAFFFKLPKNYYDANYNDAIIIIVMNIMM